MAPKYLHLRDITVPCGRCAFCLATRRSDWVQRLMVEWRSAEQALFVTLTYANPHLHFFRNSDGHDVAQLHKRDLQLWFKKVRKAGHKLRYYAVGEYGSKTYRPHYHVLLFGSVPQDVVRKTWDKGQVHIGRVTYASCGYCTKYVINSKVSEMRNGREPPFQVMSRRPGIGSGYLTEAMKAWHQADQRNYMIVDGQKRHLPRYYKEKIFTQRQRAFIGAKAQREAFDSLRARLQKLSKHHPNAIEYLQEMRIAQAKRIRDKSRQNLIH